MYKDKSKQKEANRKSMQKRRKGITEQGITSEGITRDGYVPPLGNLPERPRFLTLSDEQVLDRLNPPKANFLVLTGLRIQDIRAWADALPFRPLKGYIDKSLYRGVK